MAHRISWHGATKVTPFELVYGQEAILPVEVNLDAYRLANKMIYPLLCIMIR